MKRTAGRLMVLCMLVAAGAAVVTTVTAQQAAKPLVTAQDLLAGLKNPTRWLTYSGDYSGQRHSPLTQVTPDNVKRLSAQWTFQAETLALNRGFEATPIAVDGVLYLTGSFNYAWALDARTGRPFWRYKRDLPNNLTYGASAPVNRGFAILGDRLFMVTLDAHLLAMDRRTGAVLWDVVLADYRVGYSATLAPLIVKDKVIVGISGGEYTTRGFIDAYDPQTGKRIWRTNTIPGAGEPGSETWPNVEAAMRGGGGTWMTGTYDPEQNLLFWGTGNPNPDYYGSDRQGDNLYTCALLALDADTGQLKWHFQFTPEDVHDWDANETPLLIDGTVRGQKRKVLLEAKALAYAQGADYLAKLKAQNPKLYNGSTPLAQSVASGEIAVISVNSRPQPPSARPPRCTR